MQLDKQIQQKVEKLQILLEKKDEKNYKIIHGNTLEKKTIEKESVDLIITSPP